MDIINKTWFVRWFFLREAVTTYCSSRAEYRAYKLELPESVRSSFAQTLLSRRFHLWQQTISVPHTKTTKKAMCGTRDLTRGFAFCPCCACPSASSTCMLHEPNDVYEEHRNCWIFRATIFERPQEHCQEHCLSIQCNVHVSPLWNNSEVFLPASLLRMACARQAGTRHVTPSSHAQALKTNIAFRTNHIDIPAVQERSSACTKSEAVAGMQQNLAVLRHGLWNTADLSPAHQT